MATKTLTCVDGQSWIYPPLTYTGFDYVYKMKNHWYNGHSDLDRRGYRCYQAGNSDTDGKYNGNQLSIIKFDQALDSLISSVGGVGRVTKITLYLTCGHAWYSAMNAKICLTPYWNTTAKWGSGGLTECPYDSYDALKFKHLKSVNISKGSRIAIDLTAYKNDFANYKTIALYAPGAYNKDYNAYGWVYAHKNAGGNIPKLVVEYSTNSAPNKPGVTVHTTKDSHGYITPKLDFSVISNGDPDNNLSSTPYGWTLTNQSGSKIHDSGWTSTNRFQYDLSSYRGQTVKITGWVRDSYDLRTTTDVNVYINTQPSIGGNVNITSGVNNGVYKDNITISWSRATDAQSKHNSNLRYYVFCQKGNDNGPSADTEANRIASGLTGTSYTFDATSMSTSNGGRISVAKGERIYLSVWAWDGLEWSPTRVTSQWIYREQPPSAPSNVTPKSGHYESSVDVTWSASQGLNGTWVDHYRIELLNSSNGIVKTYTSKETSMTCRDVALISRGAGFKFKVTAVDNLGNDSTPGYSGSCTRNNAPTKPFNFRVNSDKLYFKNSIPLVWSASTDKDGDTVRYNVYFNVNNGGYQELVRGTTATTATHDISSFQPGTSFNYYVEAYDTFNIYSEKVYITSKPHVNVPPGPPSILKPLDNRKLYCNLPRIIFKTGKINNNEKLTIGVDVNGKKYNSGADVQNFNKANYGSEEVCMFTPSSNFPLNYSQKNTITIHVWDGLDTSEKVSINIPVDASIISKIGETEDRLVTAKHLTDIQIMVDDTRFAYGFTSPNWHRDYDKGVKIFKKYHEQVIDNIYSVTTYLNDNAKADHLKRNYTKNIISTGVSINKGIINNIVDMITRT